MYSWERFLTTIENILVSKASWANTPALKALVTVVSLLAIWFGTKILLHLIQHRLKTIPRAYLAPDIFKNIRKALDYLFLLAAGAFLIRTFHWQAISKPFYAVCIILMVTPIKNFLLLLLDALEKHLAKKTETKVDDIIFDLLNKFSGAIIYSIAVVIALDVIGVNVMPFVAGAGVVGIAVGFAAKDTLSNLIAGVLLIIDRPFEIGDRIEIWSTPRGTASWGDVIDIGLRATRIKTTDNLVVVIPNNEIMKRDIVNYTAMSAMIRVRIDIGVAYDTDIAKAKKVILEVAAGADWILDKPVPKVVVRNFGESSVDLQLRVWISDARRRMDTISYVTDRVKAAFDAAGIEIPYPKRDIHIISKKKVSSK